MVANRLQASLHIHTYIHAHTLNTTAFIHGLFTQLGHWHEKN